MSTDSGRLIRLRRPPVLNVLSDRWVPGDVDLGEVDALWRTLCEANPRYHDGDLLHVLGVVRNGHAGATIHVAPSSYRFHAVRRLGFDTRVRPLGVKGLVVTPDPDTGRPLLVAGLRSEESGSYPGCWEYLPGGGVEPGEDPTAVDPAAIMRRELTEELGVEGTVDPVALAILEDRAVGTWEIVYRGRVDRLPEKPPGWEHERFALIEPDGLPAPASDAAVMLAGVAGDVLRSAEAG